MTPSAAIWRKLCVDLPSAASTRGTTRRLLGRADEVIE
jgi:hypothetical protein